MNNQADPAASSSFSAPHTQLTSPLLVALGMMAAVVPFATDFYLPAFPRIAAEFGVGATGVQLCLTAIMLGGALGQMVFGPLSDRFGRRILLIVGMVLCAAASAAAATAPTLHRFALAQFFEGFGGAAGMVLSRAIITDVARDRRHAAQATNLIMAVIAVTPVLAPWLGSLLTEPIGWRGILWVYFGLVLMTLAAILLFVRESHPASRRQAHAEHAASQGVSPMAALRTRGYAGNTLIYCLTFAVLMSIISASPFVLQKMMGFTVVQYGRVFGLVALVITLAGGASAHLTARLSPGTQMKFSTPAMFLFSAVLLGMVLGGAPILWILAPLVAVAACIGLTIGNAAAAAITSVPRAAGIGSALLGAFQFLTGALAAPLVGLAGDHSALPLALMMACGSLLAAVAFHLTWRKEASDPPL